jgi:hypothetical protein
MKTRHIIYLAAPYTSQHKTVRIRRYKAVLRMSAKLIAMGLPIYSPIVHGHILEKELYQRGVQMPYDYWLQHSLAMLERSSELYVATIEGWQDSVGVSTEIEYAKSVKLPITYVGEDL